MLEWLVVRLVRRKLSPLLEMPPLLENGGPRWSLGVSSPHSSAEANCQEGGCPGRLNEGEGGGKDGEADNQEIC
jgi:hypothetical protein